MAKVAHYQVDILPGSPAPNSYYNLRLPNNRFRQYITDSSGNYIQKSDFYIDETEVISASRDFSDLDNLKLLANNGNDDIQLDIPPGLPTNWIVFGENNGDGSITIAAKSTVYLKGDDEGFVEANSYLVRSSPGAFYLRHIGSEQYVIIGNIE